MTNGTFEITISDLNSYLSCLQKWDWNSPMRENLVPKRRAVHFVFGDLIHQALNNYYLNSNDIISAIDFYNQKVEDLGSTDEKLDEQVELGVYLLYAYGRYAQKHDNFEVIDTEKRHSLRLTETVPSIFFSFKYDMLVKVKDKYFLKEFKTTQQLPENADFLAMDNQAIAYQAAAELVLGLPISGFIYTFLRKKYPTKPSLLQNGLLSNRSDIVSTYEAFYDAVDMYDLSREVYKMRADVVKASEEKNYFRRFVIRSTDEQKRQKIDDLKYIAQKMKDTERIYPSPERMKCTVCDFREPCSLKQFGEPYKNLLNTEYEQAIPR